MDREILPAGPRLQHEDVRGDVLDLLRDIELAQTIQAAALVVEGIELAAVRSGELANGVQPMVDEATTSAVDRSVHASAYVRPP